jgi:tetratricopeptide (TPR) repeat protein
MALNKAKVLKSAEKYVIQGKISHAITEYQKLIKEDPTDLPLVNTLGDLYVRIGNIPEAVKCFTKLAESYDNGGFVVRAIAMYKKVSKIEPTQVQALSRLADLYLRQGLISDARSHYLQVADNLMKKGEMENVVAIFQRVIEVDPENPAIEGRLAEVYQKLGNKPEAVRSFHSAAQKLRRKGSLEEAEICLKKASELDKNDLHVALSYAEVLSDLDKTDEALAYLTQIHFHEFNPEVLEGSFRLYLKSGRLEEAEKTVSHLSELGGNYFKLHLSLSKSYTERGDFDNAAAQIAKIANIAIEKGEGAAVENQLKLILNQNPEHVPTLLELIRFYNFINETHSIPVLLERVGRLFIRQEQLLEAASIYTQLAQLEPGELTHHENLRQVKERLGPKGENIELPRLVPDMNSIAEKFVSEPTLKTIAPDEEAGRKGFAETDLQAQGQEQIRSFIVEGDLFASYGLFQKAIDQYQKVLEFVPNHIEIRERIRDMYAKGGELCKAAQQCLILANIYTTRNEIENANKNFTLAYQYDPDLHQEPSYPDRHAQGLESKVEIPSEKESQSKYEFPAPDRRRLQELLEEIDFYFDQGFLAEAKGCIDEYLQLAPADSEVSERLERYYRLLRTQDSQQPGVETAEFVVQTDSVVDSTNEVRIGGVECTPDVGEQGRQERIEKAAGFEPTAVAETIGSDAPSTEQPKPAHSFYEMMIDLDYELESFSLEKRVNDLSPNAGIEASKVELSGEGYGLEDVFAEFKAGLEEEDGEVTDYETHYNLGIAFKEMGLLEEAIGEFQNALKGQSVQESSGEFVKCCNMLGLCFLEKGLPQGAVKWFTKGLTSPGHGEETYQALRYDLGCAHEQAGNNQAALETFLDVYAVNINYRDVAEKIENLKKSL